MKTLYFATSNGEKFQSVKRMLADTDITVIQYSLEHDEERTKEIEKIATSKVIDAYWEVGEACLASDAGFYVEDFNGFPSSFVNFVLETIGVEGLAKLTDGKSRKAEFRNAYAWYDISLAEPVTFTEVVKGKIVPEERGERGDYFQSDLYYIFVPEERNKTLAEMSKEEYEEWAHEMDRKHSPKDDIKKFIQNI